MHGTVQVQYRYSTGTAQVQQGIMAQIRGNLHALWLANHGSSD